MHSEALLDEAPLEKGIVGVITKVKSAEQILRQSIEEILNEIEGELNAKMKEFNDSLFDESRKAPNLKFKAYNSYTFETPDDTGTGSNYRGWLFMIWLYYSALHYRQ